MWIAEKLQKSAKALLPHVSAFIYAELSRGLDSYGFDSGKQLLLTFGTYFKPSMMRVYFNGSNSEFWEAYTQLESEIGLEPDNNQ